MVSPLDGQITWAETVIGATAAKAHFDRTAASGAYVS